jgi:O-antigen/teichoic acid export membrane protein
MLVPGARVGLVAMGFASNVLIVRVLGPTHFGVYALCAAMIKILSGCFGDALDLAVLRRVPLYVRTERPRALRVAWAALWLRVAVGLGVVVIGLLVSSWVAEVFFRSSRDWVLVVLAAAGVMGELLVRAASSYFQAAEMFSQFLALDALLHGGRIGILLGLLSLNALTLHTALMVYVGVSYAVFLAGLLLLPQDALRIVPANRQDLAEVFHYSKWMVVAMGIAAIYERVDVFLLGYFRGSEQVGIYAAAFTLAIIPEFVAGAVATVLYPKIVPLYVHREFRDFARRFLCWALPVALAAALGAYLFGGLVIPLLFSARYVAAIPLFQILVVGTLFSAVVAPLHAALLAMVWPRRVVAVTAAGLLAMVGGGVVVIPAMGPTGAALLVGMVRVGVGLSVVLLAQAVLRQGLPSSAGVTDGAGLGPDEGAPEPGWRSRGERG